jgi:hypothetical protein
MPTDEAKLNELPGRFVTDTGGTDQMSATDRSHPSPVGTWTIDPAHSSVSFASCRLRLWTITSRRLALGVIHLDDLPVGVIRFQQPSGLPVLTMALDPAGVETPTGDLTTMLGGPEVVAVGRYGGGRCAARAWSFCPAAPGGSWSP